MLSRLTIIGKTVFRALRNSAIPSVCRIPSMNFMRFAKPRTPFSMIVKSSPFRMFAGSYPRHKVLQMPNLSPTMTKGTITKWNKKEGDAYNAGDVLCDVETDKATVGFEMVDSGYLAKILKPEGSKDVPLGNPVCIVVDDAKDVAAFKDYSAEAAPAAAAAPKQEAKEEKKPVEEAKAAAPHSDKILASPAAKKIAADKGIDLAKVKGTGPNGRITKEDILEYIAKADKPQEKAPEPTPAPKPASKPAPKPAAQPAIPGLPEFVDIELTNYKRVAAERLTAAKQTIPHFYVSVECEMDKLMQLREELNKVSSSKISINDMLVKACALTCMKVPDANSAWMGEFVRRYKDVDMCVAVQTPIGLIAPIVPRANTKGFEQIAKETKVLIDKAKAGKLKPEEFIGGTFTISNAGMFGISQLISIINPPQACILGVSKVEKKFLVDEKKIATDKPWRIAHTMSVSLSCDHRVVDGAGASSWLAEFKKYVETPHMMIL